MKSDYRSTGRCAHSRPDGTKSERKAARGAAHAVRDTDQSSTENHTKPMFTQWALSLARGFIHLQKEDPHMNFYVVKATQNPKARDATVWFIAKSGARANLCWMSLEDAEIETGR